MSMPQELFSCLAPTDLFPVYTADTHLLNNTTKATASHMYRPKGPYFGNTLLKTMRTNLLYDLMRMT